MFGAIGVYSAAFSRALAPHAELLACIVRRPIGEGFAYWFRHHVVKREQPGFACPLWAVAAYNERPLYAKIAKFAPDLIVSCGFPRKLPAALMPARAVNVHPALLPRDRGPLPLFWCFRRGDAESGVTLHVLTQEVDGGDILAQARAAVPRGVGGAEFFAQLGTRAGELVAAQLPALLASPWSGTPQGETNAWAHKPTHADWEITPNAWRAADLWHFIRGARTFGSAWARLADDVYYFDDALAAHPGMQVPGDFILIGNEMLLRVQDGAVRLRVS